MLLSLVIPCFNEEDSLPALFTALDSSVADLTREGHQVEVLVIDDGSRDASPALLKDATTARPWLRVLRLARDCCDSHGIDRSEIIHDTLPPVGCADPRSNEFRARGAISDGRAGNRCKYGLGAICASACANRNRESELPRPRLPVAIYRDI